MIKIISKNKQNNIEIPINDLKFIIGDEWEEFEKTILTNCFCAKCENNHVTTIINYAVLLNDLDDIVLQGYCMKCNSPVGQYIETGEIREHTRAIEVLRRKYQKN